MGLEKWVKIPTKNELSESERSQIEAERYRARAHLILRDDIERAFVLFNSILTEYEKRRAIRKFDDINDFISFAKKFEKLYEKAKKLMTKVDIDARVVEIRDGKLSKELEESIEIVKKRFLNEIELLRIELLDPQKLVKRVENAFENLCALSDREFIECRALSIGRKGCTKYVSPQSPFIDEYLDISEISLKALEFVECVICRENLKITKYEAERIYKLAIEFMKRKRALFVNTLNAKFGEKEKKVALLVSIIV